MKKVNSPVNWNSNDAPDYQEVTPYRQLMDEKVDAGYTMTEWGTEMEKDPARMTEDLPKRGMGMPTAVTSSARGRPAASIRRAD